MLFPSVEFIFAFLPIVLTVYFILLRRNVLLKNIWLFAASLFFYAFGEGSFILLMLGEILLDYLLALFLNRSQKRWARRTLLSIAIISNIGILGIFKYASFVCVDILKLPPDSVGFATDIHLPLGISFFTFQALSYVLDVYMAKVPATDSFLNVGLYVSFFPQLVAGPIVRLTDIADAVNNRKETMDDFSSGVVRFLIGLCKKVLIANNMALVADAAWQLIIGDRLEASVAMAWLGAISYTLQIYFDFSGYSDMAIGLGKMFGFDFPENFDHPYIATSLTEFWRRWHITLGTFLKDYVFYPVSLSKFNMKLSQKNKFSNTKTVFYVNCDKIACFINDKIYNITIKFKKSYFEDKEDTLYVDSKLNDLEFEMIKAKIAKDEKFVNI